jgi:hypothetical protein
MRTVKQKLLVSRTLPLDETLRLELGCLVVHLLRRLSQLLLSPLGISGGRVQILMAENLGDWHDRTRPRTSAGRFGSHGGYPVGSSTRTHVKAVTQQGKEAAEHESRGADDASEIGRAGPQRRRTLLVGNDCDAQPAINVEFCRWLPGVPVEFDLNTVLKATARNASSAGRAVHGANQQEVRHDQENKQSVLGSVDLTSSHALLETIVKPPSNAQCYLVGTGAKVGAGAATGGCAGAGVAGAAAVATLALRLKSRPRNNRASAT